MEGSKKFRIHLKGLSPLIMHSDKMCNPLDPKAKQLKEISSIRGKKDEHYLAMAELEWFGALYYDEEEGLIIPAKVLLGCFQAAARKYKLGKATKALMIDCAIGVPVIGYEKKTDKQLWDMRNKSGERLHVFSNTVVVGQARLVRTLPIFQKWELIFEVYLNTELLSAKQLETILQTAGFEYGFGELRPQNANGTYGRFALESLEAIK